MSAATCVANVHSGGVWSATMRACGKTAKVERDGAAYCGLHDPVAIKAKQEKRDAKASRESAIRMAGYTLASLRRELADVVISYKAALPDVIATAREAVLQVEDEISELEKA